VFGPDLPSRGGVDPHSRHPRGDHARPSDHSRSEERDPFRCLTGAYRPLPGPGDSWSTSHAAPRTRAGPLSHCWWPPPCERGSRGRRVHRCGRGIAPAPSHDRRGRRRWHGRRRRPHRIVARNRGRPVRVGYEFASPWGQRPMIFPRSASPPHHQRRSWRWHSPPPVRWCTEPLFRSWPATPNCRSALPPPRRAVGVGDVNIVHSAWAAVRRGKLTAGSDYVRRSVTPLSLAHCR
jgi:hypothetical protein